MGRSSSSRPPLRSGCVLVLAATLIAGCSGGEDPQAGADGSSTPTSPTSTTASAAPTSSSPTSSAAPPPSSSSSSSSEAADTSSSGAPSPLESERKITLANFFDPSTAWEEERFSVADQEDVTGIAARVQACGNRSYQDLELELRLENKFDELRFSVGQSNASDSSDQNLSVEVVANNSQVEIRSIPFNELQDFSIPVESVNALKIRFTLDDKVPDCGGEVTGVIVGAVLS